MFLYIIGALLLVGLIALVTYKRDAIITWAKQNKKKVVTFAVGSSVAAAGLAGIPSLEISIDDLLIDDLSDYEALGYSVDKIVDPIVYKEQVLCEGHLPLAFTFDTLSSDQALSESQRTNLFTVEQYLQTNFDLINIDVNILQHESFTRTESVYKVTTEEDFDMYGESLGEVTRERIVGEKEIDDYRYVWKNIKDVDLTLKQGETIVVDIVGNFNAELGERSVDIVPSINIGSYEKRYSKYAWWNSNWNAKKAITLDHDQVLSTLVNFPVRINITDNDLYTDAQADGDDIAFVDSTETVQFAHEVIYYNAANGNLIADVNVTTVLSGSDTTFYMYYGNGVCGAQEDKHGTWNSGYLTVHHFLNTSFIDSTANGYDLTNDGSTIVDTDFYKGAYLDGTDEITHATLTDLTYGSIAVEWYFNTTNAADSEDIHIYKENSGGASGTYMLPRQTNNDIRTSFKSDGEAEDTTTADNRLQNDIWYYNSLVLQGTSNMFKAFWNGVSYRSDANTHSWTAGTQTDFSIGSKSSSPWTGTIDELRISTVERNDSWIITTYNTLNNATDGGFFTIGAESNNYANYSLLGLCDGQNITWFGEPGEVVWCNSSGVCDETLRISVINNNTQEITDVTVWLENMTDLSGHWFSAAHITLYASSDNISFGVPTDDDGNGNGVYLDGGSNISLNSTTWNAVTMGADPFTIENGTSAIIYCKFRAEIPGTEAEDRIYVTSETGYVYAQTFKVYFNGNKGV